MLISHETTLDTMNLLKRYNDYDYALIHLFKYAEYKEFFLNSLREGREVYLDNSVFELGEAFEMNKFLEAALEFYHTNKENFIAIVPDVLDDCYQTLKNLEEFNTIAPYDMKTMGVLQGKTCGELLECYDKMQYTCEIIGINHISQAFGPKDAPIDQRSQNRIEFIKLLDEIASKKPQRLHLLGILLPAEIIALRDCKNIYSVDTSNPVCLALEGKSYGEHIDNKPLWTIDSWIKSYKSTRIPNNILHIIIKNVNDFKEFIRS